MVILVLYMFAVGGPIGALGFALEAVQKKRKPIVLACVVAVLFAYGWTAFVVQALGACGGLPFLGDKFEWPIFFTSGTVEDSLGQRYVPHTAAGRIQMYDREGKFLRGWFVDAGGRVFKLHVTEDDELEVFIARGDWHLVFAADGSLLREGPYAGESYDALPVGPYCEITLAVPWYLFPLTSPFVAWLTGVAGMVGMVLFNKYTKPEPNKDDKPDARTSHQ
jgi:hypothetical protein